VSLTVAVDEILHPIRASVDGGVIVTVAGTLAPSQLHLWRAGRRVRMPAQLRRPARYLDPGVPDFERSLARSGTTLVGTVKSGALVEVMEPGGWWAERAGEFRHFARRAVRRAVGRWSARSAAVVNAIVIGDRAGLDSEVRRRLQDAGTYHVIAISGGNIAILAGLLLAAFRVAGCLGREAMLAAILLLAAYAGLVGGGASVERATLMACVYFAARAFDHRNAPLNALWLTGAVIVSADPLAIADPAFALTFGATFGILLAAPALGRQSLLERGPGRSALRAVGRYTTFALRGILVASLGAEALLMPIGALLFARVTLAGLVLNFLAIPLMGIVQVAGLAILPLALISPTLAAPAGLTAHLAAEGLVRSADLVVLIPALAFRVPPPSAALLAMYYGALGLGWWAWRRRWQVAGSGGGARLTHVRRAACVLAAGAAVWMVARPDALVSRRGDGRLHVIFLDVGQGDAALLRFPLGSTMLVDAGGLIGSPSFDLGDRVVAPVLRQAGIGRLDYLVLTHGDPDHVGGAPAILREFRPREIWEGIPVPRSVPLAALRQQAQSARWAFVSRGSRLIVDGVEIVVEHPAPADWERQRVRNDDSIVLDVRWRDVSVLLTGDIGRAVEAELERRIAPAPLRVLKVPHHGSLTSSSAEFVRQAGPQLAVFSAGRSNRFGHPAPAVLERYTEAGATILRTDREGAVMLDTDGYTVRVRTFSGRELQLRR
jgi:competence protein ComEC